MLALNTNYTTLSRPGCVEEVGNCVSPMMQKCCGGGGGRESMAKQFP